MNLEVLLEPWYRLPVYILVLAFSLIAIRVIIRFDINDWLKDRRNARQLKDIEKASRKCRHSWTLYHRSPLSQCNICFVAISTSILLVARQYADTKPLIFTESYDMVPEFPGGYPIITNYIGAEN